mgnify:CR=1 FL=1
MNSCLLNLDSSPRPPQPTTFGSLVVLGNPDTIPTTTLSHDHFPCLQSLLPGSWLPAPSLTQPSPTPLRPGFPSFSHPGPPFPPSHLHTCIPPASLPLVHCSVSSGKPATRDPKRFRLKAMSSTFFTSCSFSAYFSFKCVSKLAMKIRRVPFRVG